jgi:hypothetical protein
MTVREMVKHLLETGTLFDYKNVDFTKLCDKHEQFEADLADDPYSVDDDSMNVEDDGEGGLVAYSPQKALNTGETDIPVHDARFIDQRQNEFETAKPDWFVPDFEDED